MAYLAGVALAKKGVGGGGCPFKALGSGLSGLREVRGKLWGTERSRTFVWEGGSDLYGRAASVYGSVIRRVAVVCLGEWQ